MGAFMILRITFKDGKGEKFFFKKYNPIILVREDLDTSFIAWKYFYKPKTYILFMGFMGYAEPLEIKKELKGKIKYFDWIPINDKNGRWDKELEKI